MLVTGSLYRGWRKKSRNLRALLVRDLMMRYGRTNIGFVWSIVEPMILCLGVMVIWSAMGGGKNGVRVVELVLTGYMPLTMWRHTTGGAVRLFRTAMPLLYHRSVTLFDIITARFTIEFIGSTVALLVIWSTLNAFGVVGGIARLDLMLVGWLMMGWFSLASAMAIAAMTEYSEASEKFVAPIQYLNIPLSASFFLVDWLPPWAQSLILLHPHAHCYEVFREGYFGNLAEFHYDIPYFVATAFVMTFIGVLAVAHVRDRVELN